MSSFLWKIGGEAGFGIMTIGYTFAQLAARHGYHTADYAEYPSLIRGGHNTYEVHFSSNKIRSSKRSIDILVCLNKETYMLHKKRLSKDSIVLYDKEMFPLENPVGKALHIPIRETLQTNNAPIVMMNTFALGASLAAMNWPIEIYLSMIETTFAGKDQSVIEMNEKMAKAGYDFVKNTYPEKILSIPFLDAKNEKVVLSGNDAFALGAVVGDCRLYSAYPMTPSSTILTTLAGWAEKNGMIVRHAEDEISVINTALGGAFAGVRSAVGTSGGGFSLMVESISFAGVAEIPIVIFMGQRPGPATGMPTWTEQGDLLFIVHAGHGEFPKIILAPGDVEEMYEMSAEAFNLADIYQTPVIIISDKHLSESHWSTGKMELQLIAQAYTITRGKIVEQIKDDEVYKRYKVTEDGVSPMLIPGQQGLFYQANSYEHLEDGHTTEDAKERIQQVDKRNKKTLTFLQNHFQMPKIYGDIDTADIVFISWGSNKGVILDVMEILNNDSNHVALIHFSYIYPLDEKKVLPLLTKENKRYILVENNSHGQFGKLLRQEIGVEIKEKLLKYDGRQIFVEEIIEYLK
ncbi:hypothetical protein A2957_00255 [Candidatus Roizmanbacteria bacterium RIFCSPLOWO2_01_FULL_38_11]|uniref:2-oxoacid:ferredoxin oxidoreductase subunit alpha n=1 Tax=Candidatus Roizmanbacteria bacterium RIFCSPLOWO2_01_FULL_38_11 TaxID=1802060 RepID=A0A1F7ILZ5_9BACT|nr:MAG: hypothetical protein A2957_00255 [Candidatus Roizmanbacteria bacterium RIFCSPLOWO2_01_FULL_38_11]